MNQNFAKMRRRDFLRLASIGGLILLVPSLKFLPRETPRQAIQKSAYAMGTTVTIVVEDEASPYVLDAAISSSFEEINALERLLTRFQPSSDVSRLNTVAEIENPSDAMLSVLTEANRFSELTEGAFDVTVKPALDLMSEFLSGGPGPSDADFEAAQKLINYESVVISSDTASFARKGMGMTLDGIGTGYIIDRAASKLRSCGVRSALVQVGGTLVAIGSRADGSPWPIGVRDPLNENGLIGTLQVKDQAVATSGDYENYFTPDKRFYHIVDPATARSPLYSHSATVVAPTAMDADAMGVSLMVRSPRDGLLTIDGLKGFECLIAARDGSKVASAGLAVSE